MNKVILMGRLTKDPEMRQTQSGLPVCSFNIAVNRRFAKEGQQTADFLNCTAWRNTAEFITKYFTKGNMILVLGSLKSRSWDGSDGKKQYATDILVEEAYFTGSKTETAVSPSANTEFVGDMSFQVVDGSDDDLPF